MLHMDALISPPINKSLADAFQVMRAAPYPDPIEFVRLRQALNFGPSGPQEPSYEFHFPKADFEIHVGPNTACKAIEHGPSKSQMAMCSHLSFRNGLRNCSGCSVLAPIFTE